MSKTSETKNRILKILGERDMRLVELAPKLGLTPATVLQHLRELEEMGFVKKVDDPHFRNVKYYALDSAARAESIAATGANRHAGHNQSLIAFAIATASALIVVIMFVMFGSHGTTAVGAGEQHNGVIELMIQEPTAIPGVEPNISITYESVYAHMAEANGTGLWLAVSPGGAMNVISSTSKAHMLGEVPMSNGAVIDGLAFNITSAQITVNGTSYNVSLRQNQVLWMAGSKSQVANETMGVMLLLSPSLTMVQQAARAEYLMNYTVSAVTI